MFEYLKLIFPLFIAVVGASLTFLYTQHLNRRSRAEQYQLEQIETIIKSLIANDFASSHSTDQEEIKQAHPSRGCRRGLNPPVSSRLLAM